MTAPERIGVRLSVDASLIADPILKEKKDEINVSHPENEEETVALDDETKNKGGGNKLVNNHGSKSNSSAGNIAEEFIREKKKLPSVVDDGLELTNQSIEPTISLKGNKVSSEGDLVQKLSTSNISSQHNSSDPDETHPHNLLVNILKEKGCKATMRKSSSVKDFFLEITEEGIAAFDQDVARAVRENNITFLRERRDSGKTLQSSNRFGESLIHMACRRGSTEVVRFFIKEANVSLRVKDDFGRTPLHDACWSPEPNFKLMELLISHDPDLLMIEDVRGHSPFSYARKNHWGCWKKFLSEKRDIIELKTFWEAIE